MRHARTVLQLIISSKNKNVGAKHAAYFLVPFSSMFVGHGWSIESFRGLIVVQMLLLIFFLNSVIFERNLGQFTTYVE